MSDTVDDDFLLSLYATFKEEVDQYFKLLRTEIANLKGAAASNVERPDLVQTLYRAAHTIKGAARAVEASEVEQRALAVEESFKPLRNVSPLVFPNDFFNRVDALVDALEVALDALAPAPVLASDAPAEVAAPVETRVEQPVVEGDEQADFDRELQELFHSEAESYLTTLGQDIIRLEQSPSAEASRELVAEMYRLLHSLKGNARAVSNQPTESICQAAESLFSALKKGRVGLTLPVFDVVHETLSLLEVAVSNPTLESMPRQAAELEARINLLAAGFVQTDQPAAAEPAARPDAPRLASGEAPTARPTASTPAFVERRSDRQSGETLRIVASKLNNLVLKIEEMLSVKLSMRQRISDLRAIRNLSDNVEREWSLVSGVAQNVRQLLDNPDTSPALAVMCRQLLDQIAWHQRADRTFANRIKGVLTDCESDSVAFNNLVGELQEDSKKMLLAPVSSILGPFPRSVREIARSMGKEVVFTTYGTLVEVDRRVLEGIKDPLLHIIRNSVYHGLESPEVRKEKGKNPVCSVVLSVAQVDANKVEITVADDGRGIDVEQIRKVAVERGMPQADVDRLTEPEVVSLIFQSDFSTSKQVGDIAGRGLGLAIVREHIQNLGGVVLVEYTPGAGTRFILRLPLSMATSRGVLVRLKEQTYVLPTPSVQRVVRVARSDIRIIEGRENIVVQGFPIPLVALLDVLGLKRGDLEEPEFLTVVILEQGDRRIALEVDAVLNEQEVLVKNFPAQLEWVPNLSASTVLGSGDLALILRVGDLIDYTYSAGRVATRPVQRVKKSVLVVDDSATSRGLLTQVLGQAGYDVSTAVDGADALARLLARRVDVVLSDVEMPRMNGYALVERVRAEKSLADIPVILLSTLDAEEDKKKGIKAGANAYLAKGGFNQTVLLNTISRLA